MFPLRLPCASFMMWLFDSALCAVTHNNRERFNSISMFQINKRKKNHDINLVEFGYAFDFLEIKMR